MTPQHALQARDDSIAGFQLLQQQAQSPKHQQRLDHMASQLQDTQAQLLTTQVLISSPGQEDHVQYRCYMIILHNTAVLLGFSSLGVGNCTDFPSEHSAFCQRVCQQDVSQVASCHCGFLRSLLSLPATKLNLPLSELMQTAKLVLAAC